MEKYTVFMGQKNQYSENEYTIKSNLQIQCNSYQAAAAAAAQSLQSCPTLCNSVDGSPPGSPTTNGIFQRTRTNNFTICMEIQKTSNSQRNLEKEERNRRKQPA